MKKLIILVLVCSLTMAFLQGCSKKEINDKVEDVTPIPDVKVEETPSTDLLFENISKVLGEEDRKVEEVFGKGEVEKNETNEVAGRFYKDVEFLKEKVELSFGYDQGKCIFASINLLENDFETYKNKLVTILGDCKVNEGEITEEGSGSKQTIWEKADVTITLIEAYGTISLMVE